MPFEKLNVQEEINKRRSTSKEFEQLWEEGREEYRLIGEMISIRKLEKVTSPGIYIVDGKKKYIK